MQIKGYFANRMATDTGRNKFSIRLQANSSRFPAGTPLLTPLEIFITANRFKYGVSLIAHSANGSTYRTGAPTHHTYDNVLYDLAPENEFVMDLVIYPAYVFLAFPKLSKLTYYYYYGVIFIDALFDVVQINGDHLHITSATMVVGGAISTPKDSYYPPPFYPKKMRTFNLNLEDLEKGKIVPFKENKLLPKESWEVSFRGKIGSNR